MTTLVDDFNRADGNVGAGWAHISSGSDSTSGMTIASNQVSNAAVDVSSYRFSDTFGEEQEVALDYVGLATGDFMFGPVCSFTYPAGSGYYWEVKLDSIKIVVPGVGYIATYTPTLPTNGTIKIQRITTGSGTCDLKTYVDADLIGTHSVSSGALTGTKVGVYNAYADTASNMDAFYAQTYVAASGVGGGRILRPVPAVTSGMFFYGG